MRKRNAGRATAKVRSAPAAAAALPDLSDPLALLTIAMLGSRAWHLLVTGEEAPAQCPHARLGRVATSSRTRRRPLLRKHPEA